MALGEATEKHQVPILTASSRTFPTTRASASTSDPRNFLSPFHDLARHVLRPPTDSVLRVELRRVLIGTGLVPEGSDLDWLTRNVDLAMPYPAMRFLCELASKLRVDASIDSGGLDRQLTRFLASTDVFREIEQHVLQVQRTAR